MFTVKIYGVSKHNSLLRFIFFQTEAGKENFEFHQKPSKRVYKPSSTLHEEKVELKWSENKMV